MSGRAAAARRRARAALQRTRADAADAPAGTTENSRPTRIASEIVKAITRRSGCTSNDGGRV